MRLASGQIFKLRKVIVNHRIFLLAALTWALAGAAPAHAQQSTSPGLKQRLSELLSQSREEELIEPDLAFSVKMRVAGPNLLAAELIPARGYYMYRDKVKFVVKEGPGVSIKSVSLPKGTPRKDPTFGTTETWSTPVQAEITLERPAGARSVTLTAFYQGCHEKTGVCYPPLSKDLVVALP